MKTNLQAGRIRMLFVADEIPPELQRIIEFLNEQMDPAEVLAVEIKQFSGNAVKTLVPHVIGLTAEAGERKRVGAAREKRQWDEASFFDELSKRGKADEVRVARQLLDWANSHVTRVWWGQGVRSGSFVPVLETEAQNHHFFALYHEISRDTPALEIYFQTERTKPPFANAALRREWLRRLNQIPGVKLPDDSINRRPNFPLRKLAAPDSMKLFLDTMNWAIDQILIESTAPQSTPNSP